MSCTLRATRIHPLLLHGLAFHIQTSCYVKHRLDNKSGLEERARTSLGEGLGFEVKFESEVETNKMLYCMWFMYIVCSKLAQPCGAWCQTGKGEGGRGQEGVRLVLVLM